MDGINTVRDAVLSFLREKGMTRMFGNPGSTELPLFRDFPADFRYHLALQEAVAVSMADGYAQTTNAAAFVNLHSAAGVGHAMGAIFTAFCNRTPLVIVAGQQARSLLLHAPFLMSEQATELPKPYVKFSVEPARAEDVPMAIARAWFHAMCHPRGPVLVSVPVDDWDRPAALVPLRSEPTGPDCADISCMLEALAAARSPVIVVGGEVDRDGAWDAVVNLVDNLDCGVWQTPNEGRLGFPQTHPNFLGLLSSSPDGVLQQLASNDLVIAIGSRAFSYHVDGSNMSLPAATGLFMIGADPIYGAAACAGTALIARIEPTVRALVEATNSQRRTPDKLAQHARKAFDLGGTLTAEALVSALDAVRNGESVIVEEAATARALLPRFLPIERANSFMTCASGGLGFGIPAAIGVAIARPHERTIALIGDGAAMYTIQALYSAVRERANVTFIIINNQGYAAIDMFGELFGINEVPGTDLSDIDFVGLARSQGMTGELVDDRANLVEALQRALNADGPFLLEVRVSRGEQSSSFQGIQRRSPG